MAAPLHDIEALIALAQGAPGRARTWAAERAVILDPARFGALPDDEVPSDVMLAVGPPGLVERLMSLLREPAPSVSLAGAAGALGTFGMLPDDRSDLAGALAAGIAGDGSEADLWLAFALAQMDRADETALAAASRVESPDRAWLLPVVLLRVAHAMGAVDRVIGDVAKQLVRLRDTSVTGALLSALGVPPPPNDVTLGSDVAWAAARGAAMAGGEPPALTLRRGSRRRQVQGAVHDLTQGRSDPAATLIRALAEVDPNPPPALVALAAWLHAFTPGDPVDDVLHRGGGADTVRLSAARAAVTPDMRDHLAHHLDHASLEHAVLAMPLVAGDQDLAWGVVGLLTRMPSDLRADTLACAAAWHCADRVPELLGHRGSRDLGLLLACWTPTVEVLEALLDLPVPADLEPRVLYAQALAAMGDPAAVPVLAALREHDEGGDLAEPISLAEQILHRPIQA